MTLDEFTIEITQLQEFYGKEYNYAQKQIFFEELKAYPVEKFGKVIRFLEKTEQYKPTLDKILSALQKPNSLYAYKEEKPKVECKICKGTGYIMHKRKINNSEYDYVCLCTCQNAEGLEYDGNKIADKEHKSKFYIAKAEEVFGNTDIKT